MNKKFLLAIVALLSAMVIFAQEAPADAPEEKKSNVEVTPDIFVTHENWIQNQADPTDEAMIYMKYRMRMSFEGGVNIKFNKKYTLTPFVRFHKVDFHTDTAATNNLKFKNGNTRIGLKFNGKFADCFSLNAALFQWNYFDANVAKTVGVGLGGSLGMNFTAKKAFFTANLFDEPSIRFNRNLAAGKVMTSSFVNYFDYGFRFNVFNFINNKVNTGFYGNGEFEIDLDSEDNVMTTNRLYNEVYVGIKSSPVNFFDCWVAFCAFAETTFNGDLDQIAGKQLYELGLQTGVTFKYKWISVTMNTEPHLYNQTTKTATDDWEAKGIYNKIKFQVTFSM